MDVVLEDVPCGDLNLLHCGEGWLQEGGDGNALWCWGKCGVKGTNKKERKR